MNIEIISFGYLHGDPPAAHITLDLRHHFRDPHVRPELRHLTAHDAEVQAAVATTPGIVELVSAGVRMVHAFGKGPTPGPVRVAVGCAGGRHRAASFAIFLGAALGTVHVEHRDLLKPVVDRDAKGNRS
ncbi:RNA binding protein [Streptomyces phage Maih]|uniref:RNA binding protein n=5 Tax=Woodruffvirus TP1604 TaxID=1982746 RepID=A0A1P8VW06_9CAUD|nr:ATPase [Streptomyces phage TP1604]ALY07304.1 RNA binding protein [Streptomyces phage Maih]APZ82224.1 RNA binding protein [Streptomyces phage BabyGotBac]AWN08415.1 RNA binding protein [Streptomyces phage BayC]AWN08485.1 RNA binding protein [Streptomyces phage Salete]USH45430.1 RNA binding protein [Streptomyces phage Asis]